MTIPQLLPVVRAVEFFGLPGAGKTTIAHRLVTDLKDEGVNVAFSRHWMGDDVNLPRRTARRLGMIAGQLRHEIRRPLTLSGSIASESRSLSQRLHSTWNFMSVKAMQHRQINNESLLVLDQGVIQALWTASMGGDGCIPDSALQSTIGDPWLEQTLFVELSVKTETARNRLASRAKRTSQMQDEDRFSDQRLWDRGAAVIADLRKALLGELARRHLTERLVSVHTDRAITSADVAQLIARRVFNE